MNTRVYRNFNNENGGRTTEVRSSTPMERAKSRAAGYSAILVVMMLALAVTVTTLALGAPKKNGGDPVGTVPIVFAAPISGEFNITKYYADDKLQWNETAKQWQGFKAVNIQADLGTAVVATYAGTISEVSNSSTHGTVVKIQHADGLMTVYSGLDPTVDVKRGDYVEKGQRIGKFGSTLQLEAKSGPTMRLEVYENGKKVNPEKYIVFGDNK